MVPWTLNVLSLNLSVLPEQESWVFHHIPPQSLQCPHLTPPLQVVSCGVPEKHDHKSLNSPLWNDKLLNDNLYSMHNKACEQAWWSEDSLRRGGMWLQASFLSLSIPAPLSSLKQPLEVPQRTGCWALWADFLKPRCQTDQQAGQHHTDKHGHKERQDKTAGAKEKNRLE